MFHQLQINNKIETNKTIKAAPFKKEIRNTTAHRHNHYFEIIYLSKGSGFHFIDLGKYAVAPPVMYFVRQEQIHYWELYTEPEGYVVIIKKSFIEQSLDNELKSLFTRISKQCCFQLDDNCTIETILKLLTKEINSDRGNMFTVTEGLLKSLLAKVLEVAKPLLKRAEVKEDLYQSLIELLSFNGGIKNKVNHYAEKLHTSPQNLNTACRIAANHSAAEVLSYFTISEAKRLLLYTDNTVSEISFALEFNDPSHFVKYFKRITGGTPQSFRFNN